tara:strand:- start:100 stop:243 length:144 start_codon:yes stop_codon:yes gene_type:complete
MLFKFGKFWKSIFTVCGAWIFYALVDYQFTIITLLAIAIATQYEDEE